MSRKKALRTFLAQAAVTLPLPKKLEKHLPKPLRRANRERRKRESHLVKATRAEARKQGHLAF